ncbi:hypothetical protein FOZ63_019384, partial [Perkinsus olseni]
MQPMPGFLTRLDANRNGNCLQAQSKVSQLGPLSNTISQEATACIIVRNIPRCCAAQKAPMFAIKQKAIPICMARMQIATGLMEDIAAQSVCQRPRGIISTSLL